jgi:hypothetical protein
MISIYHYPTNNRKLALLTNHPIQVNNILNELLHYLVHFVCEGGLHVLSLRNVLRVW